MDIRLVHDASNVEPLDVYNFQDIAGCARRYADQLEAGEQGEPERVILVAILPDGIALSIWGENANGYEIVGILEAAKLRAHETNVLGGE
jgi:hypothetical protein